MVFVGYYPLFSYPRLLDDASHWILVGGLVYCLVLFRYEHPSLMDFLSVVVYFGSVILRFILFVTYCKAATMEYYYQEPMLNTWILILGTYRSDYLAAFGVFILASFFDFFLVKNCFSRKQRWMRRMKYQKRTEINLNQLRSHSLKLRVTYQLKFYDTSYKIRRPLNTDEHGLVDPSIKGVFQTKWIFNEFGTKFVDVRCTQLTKHRYMIKNWLVLKKLQETVKTGIQVETVMIDFKHDPRMAAQMVQYSQDSLDRNYSYHYDYFFTVYDIRNKKELFKAYYCHEHDSKIDLENSDVFVNFDSTREYVQVFVKDSSEKERSTNFCLTFLQFEQKISQSEQKVEK